MGRSLRGTVRNRQKGLPSGKRAGGFPAHQKDEKTWRQWGKIGGGGEGGLRSWGGET